MSSYSHNNNYRGGDKLQTLSKALVKQATHLNKTWFIEKVPRVSFMVMRTERKQLLKDFHQTLNATYAYNVIKYLKPCTSLNIDNLSIYENQHFNESLRKLE